jgi:hypothetical protein
MRRIAVNDLQSGERLRVKRKYKSHKFRANGTAIGKGAGFTEGTSISHYNLTRPINYTPIIARQTPTRRCNSARVSAATPRVNVLQVPSIPASSSRPSRQSGKAHTNTITKRGMSLTSSRASTRPLMDRTAVIAVWRKSSESVEPGRNDAAGRYADRPSVFSPTWEIAPYRSSSR